jgi:hypothetical protein
VFFASLIPAQAAVSPIHMDVEQVSKTATAKPPTSPKGGKPAAKTAVDPMAEKTQHRELKIKLLNNSNESFSNLVVKYWFFGRDMKAKSHQADVLKSGERKASLGPRASETVESEQVMSKYVEEHNKPAAGGKGGKGGGGKAAKIPASGQKIMGFAVKVYNGDKILAQYYSEDAYKQRLNGDVK